VILLDNKYDVIIIGGGPCGYTAALYSVRAGLRALVLEKLSPGGQMATTSEIDNYPGFDEGIDGYELSVRMQKGAERFGAVTEFAEVTSLDLSADPKIVYTTGGKYEAPAIIIATGASPKELGVPGEAKMRGRGVSYCATCDAMFFRGRTVAVVGGGNSAAADALVLSRVCSKVYVVHRRDKLRASNSYLLPLNKANNIEFVWNALVDRIIYDDEAVTGLSYVDKVTGESSVLPCDGIFVAIGRKPVSGLVAGQLDIDEYGYIIADETTRTAIPGVFVAGDVRTKQLRQIVTAVADGAMAAEQAQEYISSLA
jgi:thioredoxin reductase (NADPH)